MEPKIRFSSLSFFALSVLSVAVMGVDFVHAQCTPPPAGIVGWWKGDGNAADTVAGNNGTMVNTGYTNGVDGLSFSFDPENFSYGTFTGIRIADQPAYALTNALTIEGWIRPRGDGYMIFFRGDNRPGLDPYSLAMQGNNTLLFGIGDESGNSAFVETTIPYNVWTHIATTFDAVAGTMSIYTNGVLAVQTNTPVRPFGNLIAGDSPGVGIGNINDGFNNFPFYGDIDEIALYSRALSQAEIAAIYHAGSAGKCTPGSGSSCTPPPAGIVSWWRGENNASDAAGANSGTWNGGGNVNSYAAGEVNQAMQFDGTHRDRVDLGNPASLQLQNFTIEAWVKRASASVVSLDENFADGSIAGPGGYVFGYGAGGYALVVFDDGSFGLTQNSVNDTRVPPVLTDTNWHHVAVAKAGTTVTMFVDGVQQPTPSLNPYTNVFTFTTPVAIGSRGDGGGNTFIGSIDELAVYNRALSPNEVAAIYYAGSAGKCTGASVVSGVPQIFNVSPVSGIVGSSVTITGTNFNPIAASNIVYFGAVRANVSSAAPGSLTVTVPPGATFGSVTVAVGGLTAFSGQFFQPTFIGNGSNITTSSFAPSFNLPGSSGPQSLVIADLDGDGKPDLAFVNGYNNLISIYRNISTNGAPLGAASFAPRLDLNPATNGVIGSSYRLRAVDLDGDGRLDLIVSDVNSDHISIFHNVAAPGSLTANSFEAPFTLSVSQDTRFATAADLDGDGRVDIVALNYGAKTISIFENIGTPGILNASSFAPPVLLPAPGGPYEVAIADLDGDGKPDLAVANSDSATVSVYQNLATPGIITSNSFAPRFEMSCGGGNTEAIIAVDLDGDGKLDLVADSGTGDTVNVFRNISGGGLLTTNSFAPRVDFGTPGWMHTVSVADFNGDGKPDLGVCGELGSFMAVFQNAATPGSFASASFAPQVDFSTGWNAWGIAAGDLDGDGRPDIVFGNYYDNTIQIYQNQIPFGGPLVAPAITMQPTNLTVTISNAAVFSVTASGTLPLSFQWSFGGTNISGATNNTLTLGNVQPWQAGNYSVSVSNLAGGIQSSSAVLTVYVPPTPPAIFAQTPNRVVLVGDTATFGVSAGGSAPLSYFWSRNGTLIPGATNSVYNLPGAQLSDSGSEFNCLVTNLYGFANSTNVSLKVIDTVANDLCSGAIVITNAPYTNYQSTLKASSFGDPTPDCVDGFGHGVWYQFTASVNGQLVVDTFGSDFDTGLAIYTGASDSLTEVACNDDFGGVTSQVTLPTITGTTYFILAGGYDSDAGNLVLHLNYFTPPAFALQPTNLFVVVSSNAVFSPTLSGTLPMSFQWFFNNAPMTDGGRISGSTNSTLTIASVQTNDGGNYFLVASNFVGVTTSSVAVLTPVILPPVFLQLPASQSVAMGSNANFFAVVDGTPPYNFQWSFNGSPLADDGVHIAGSATSSLTISNLMASDAGTYSLTVTNVSGSTNASATLVVMIPPQIYIQPPGRSVPPGLPTIFTVSLYYGTGIPTPALQWQLNGTNIPGAVFFSYTNNAVGSNDLGFYQLIASNTVGSATSQVAQLTFGPVAAWGDNSYGESFPPPGLSNVVGIAGSSEASFAIRGDGHVVSWGSGAETNVPPNVTNVVAIALSGSLSADYALRTDGTVTTLSGTSQNLSNIVSIAAGEGFAVALRAEGTAVGLGNLSLSAPPAGLNHVVAISCGHSHTLALRSDGTVVTWGLSPGTNMPAGISSITAVAAGFTQSLALCANGTVAAWGSGLGTNVPAGLSNVVAISTSLYDTFSLALRTDGTVVAWGGSPPPAALSNLLTVAIAAAPFNHGLALVNNGSPQILQPPVGLTAYTGRKVTLQAIAVGAAPLSYQWLLNGTNVPGATNMSLVLSNLQFANGGNYQLFVSNAIATAISLPAPVHVISNTTLLFLSQTSASATNVYQAGKVTFYSGAVLGSGPLSYQWFFSPTNKNYAVVAGATNDTLALDPALALQSGNYYVAVSNSVTGLTSAPVNVRVMFAKAWGNLATDAPFVLTNATAIAVGNYGTGTAAGDYLALSSAGKISSWSSGPVTYGETNFSALSNSIVTAIAAGYGDTLALKSDGTLFAAGYGVYGISNIPATAVGITAIACGDYHDLALRYDGTVVGWGQNTYGQTTNAAATNVVAIAAGGQNSIALRADGSVTTWGFYGPQYQYPVPLTATNVIAVAAGGTHFLALRANGTVVGWGNNSFGQTTIPASWSNIVAISAGGNHSTALRNNGTVLTLGNSYAGVFSNNVPADLTNVIAIASSVDHDLGLFGTRAPAFTVQPWSWTVFNTATSVWFSAKCSGVQPVTYQWRLNGTNLPAATNDTLTITAQRPPQGGPLLPLQSGVYQLVASNAYGVVASKYAQLTVLIPLGVALNATNLNWTTSGDAQWFGETNVTHDGVSAAQSGDIGPLQETILQTTVGTNQAGSYTFWWKVSSELDFDFLEFRINGIVQTNISGEVDWQQVVIPAAAGTNVLMWRYSKNSIYGSGSDAGWVDQFAYLPAPPVITVQPVSQTVNMGTNVTFFVTATGSTPDLHYQWRHNGNLIGGSSPLLTLDNVGRAQNGTYFVTVTNTTGSTVSSNAVLKVNVPQLLASPQLLPGGTFQLLSTDANGGLLMASNLPNFSAQASTDLVNWVTLPNALSLTNGMLLLQDNGSNYTTRYYRIIEH